MVQCSYNDPRLGVVGDLTSDLVPRGWELERVMVKSPPLSPPTTGGGGGRGHNNDRCIIHTCMYKSTFLVGPALVWGCMHIYV